MTRLAVSQLRVTYGSRTVVDVEELGLEAGEVVTVVGDAGGGKSTLAAAIAGAVPARGAVRVDGRLLSGAPSQRVRHGLAAALRDASRLGGCTVLEVLRLADRGSGRHREALARLPQLGGRRAVPAQLLSGGEQQLLRVAAAWCTAPKALVLDSPTVGLAADAAAAVSALARDQAEQGAAVLWLEQDERVAPSPPRFRLAGGRLTPLTPGETAEASR